MERTPASYLWLIILVLHVFYLGLLSQLNYTLSSLSLFLFINGAFITFPALFFPFGHGLTTTLLFSLFYDAGESWTLGTSMIPHLTAFVAVYYLRNRIRHEKKRILCTLILLVNLGLYLYYMVVVGTQVQFTEPFILQNIVHLTLSQILLVPLFGWIVAQQKSTLLICHVDVDSLSHPAK